MENSYIELIETIIKHQESIIGPLAWNEAAKVQALKITNNRVTITGEGKIVIEHLVEQYELLFGQASVEACKDAVRPLIAKMNNIDLPQILQ